MRWAGVIALLICGAYTEAQLQDWSSPMPLWRQAVTVSPLSARAALNYGVALDNAGEDERAIEWYVRAGNLSHSSPRGTEVRAVLRSRLLWMTAFGATVCGRPDVQPYCS